MKTSRFISTAAACLVVWSSGLVVAQDAVIEELKKEMAAPVAPEVQAPAPAEPVEAPKPAEANNLDALLKPATVPAASPAPAEKLSVPAAGVEAAKPIEDAVKNLGNEERQKTAKLLADMEKVRREALDLEGHKSMDAADKAFKQGEYMNAANQYRNALSKLPNIPANQALRERASARLPECEYEAVLALIKQEKPKEALAMAQAALLKYPQHKGLQKTVDKLSKDQGEDSAKVSKVDDGTRMSPVQKQMLEGKRQIAARQYDEARASFESVLAVEPDNREAMRYLKEVGDRQYANNSVGRSAAAAKMTADVRKEWIPEYRMIKTKQGLDKGPVPTKTEPLLEKMSKIIIPEIEFRQANINDVVDFLNKASIEGDKLEPDPTKRGVNIILHLSPAGGVPAPARAPGAEGDLFGAPQPGAGGGGGGGVSDITFTARYISLLSALKIITKVAGLKFQIDGNIVMIVREGEAGVERVEIRMYPVEPTFIERVKAAGEQPMAGTQTRGGKELTQIGSAELATGMPDLKTYFENMGMKWPQGSQITYNSAIGKVIVANTPENLAVFEQILKEINVVPKQVEIEARFVEVNETDLQEMGLEWLLSDNWEIATKKAGPFTPPTALQRIQMDANSTAGGFTKGLRYMGTGGAGETTALAGGAGTMGKIFSISSVLTNPELSMVLHLLQQNGNADLLSAPKVTTRAGTEASIRVVTEYIYPTAFEVQGGTLTTGSTGTGGTAVQETTVVPQDFATREVGVILTVMPEVSPDGNMINLTMTPSVVTEPTWYQYGSTIRRADGSEQILNMPQPFFHVRTLTTQISIYDGATVVMGGLITEDLKKTNDKIPVLGDIPILGLLFRSQSEHSVKKNLMIFVTARLVDPAGRAIREPEKASDEAGKLVTPKKAVEDKQP